MIEALTVLMLAVGVSISVGYAAYAAIKRWSPHEGPHVRFIATDEPHVALWYCTACGESGEVDDDARNSGGFLHGPVCRPPE